MPKQLFIITLIICSGCYFLFTNCNSISKTATDRVVKTTVCDTATFHLSNDENDTTKILFISGAVFDTIDCMLHGYLIDNKTFLPILNASIILKQKENEYHTVTNQQGEFEFFNLPLCNSETWDLTISHSRYNCMKIKYKQYHGGVWLTIKLQNK